MNEPLVTDDRVVAYMDRYAAIAAQNRVNLDFWSAWQQRLLKEDIELLPLKGLDLLLRVPSQLGRRPMYDIDLLVLPQDVGRFSCLLEGSGFRQKSYRGFLLRSRYDTEIEYQSADTTMRLDVSWSIWYLDTLQPLWQRRVVRNSSIGPVRLLHPEDALLYLMAYVVAHRGQLSPVFVQDLDVFLSQEKESIDWPRWTAEVKRCHLQIPVWHGLQYAVTRGLTAFPDSVFSTLAPQTLSDRSQLFYYKRAVTESPRQPTHYLFPFIAAPGWRGKKRLLRQILLPPPIDRLRGLQHRGIFLSGLRMVIKSLQLALRSMYLIPQEIFQLFKRP